jgi:leucine dehydrogenase
MSYKNALAGLPAGGGKAVIMLPQGPFDRTRLFQAFGRAVDRLSGLYITAEDVGSTVQDMLTVASQTSHVAGLPPDGPSSAGGDPSPWTALGVFLSIEAAVRYKLGRGLDGVCVAVQGLGSVGFRLCEYLNGAGADLIVADLSTHRTSLAAAKFNAQIMSPEHVHEADADVFAPCALGGVLNAMTIPQIRAQVVCGAANNQLGDTGDGTRLRDRGVLYCPDYVVNSGGIINVMAEYAGDETAWVEQKIQQIPLKLLEIVKESEAQGAATNETADQMAIEITRRR